MRTAVLAAFLSATVLAGSSVALAAGGQAGATTPPVVAPPAPLPQGDRPAYGEYGFDTAGMNRAVAAGDDFYGYANGTWARNTPIPADKANYGAFDLLADLSRDRTHGILEEARRDPASKIGTAYASYLDTARIDSLGLAPIQPWLDRIKAVTTTAQYATLIAEAARNGVSSPLGTGVGQDARNPEVYIVGMRQSGLGMPDRDYYLSTDAHLVAVKQAYLGHLTRVLTLAGEPNAAARAQAILDFETQIATASWTRVRSRDANATYNRRTVAQLQAEAPGFDFRRYLTAMHMPMDDVVVAQPSAITGIAHLIATTPIAVLRDQLLVRSLDSYADVLPHPFDQERFAYAGTTLSGVPQQEERWKRAVGFTSAALADDVSRIYVQRYFPPETKAAADRLVHNVIAAMRTRLGQLEWMSPATRARAQAKLDAFTPKIGYPSQWHDYAALRIVAGDAYGNKLRATQWDFDDDVSKLGHAVRHWEWGMTPMTVNAYANPVNVEIVFPAAILQPPFFDPHADAAINYGGIGAVIGHEMSHHFDDQGSKFDEHGRLADWWTPQDVTRFQALTGQLVNEYNLYEPVPGIHVNGALTLGENIADLAGLTVAHDAYLASLDGRPAPTIAGTTGDQRFYLGWAQVWRRTYRDADLRQRLLTDPHSPSEQRAAIVRNMDPWYQAFNVQPGQRLYLAPAQRVRIW